MLSEATLFGLRYLEIRGSHRLSIGTSCDDVLKMCSLVLVEAVLKAYYTQREDVN